MKELSRDITQFLEMQGVMIVSTFDGEGGIHCSVKGIVGIEESGKVYLIDLYRTRTFRNLAKNPAVSITAVDERRFKGFVLKGKGKIIERDKIKGHIISKWEERVIQKISRRLIKNLQEEKKNSHHPEAKFPPPQYLIVIEVDEIVDLTPQRLKKVR